MSLAYGGFTGMGLLGVVCSAIATDHGGWVPHACEEFNGLFWGVFLDAAVIPATALSWLVDTSFEPER